MSRACSVRLSHVGICEASARNWRATGYRVNRIHFPLSGRAHYRDGSELRLLTPGCAYLLINGYSQDLLQIPGSNYRHLYFDFQCTPPLLSREILSIPLEKDPVVTSFFETARILIEQGVPCKDGEYLPSADLPVFSELEDLLSAAVSYLCRTYGLSVVENEKIEAALQYIRDHYAEPIRNADLAGALHVDPRYLIRLFRRYTSASPYQYLTQYRIERAEEFLRRGRTVSEVSFACGYRNETSFRLAYKRVTGKTPGRICRL